MKQPKRKDRGATSHNRRPAPTEQTSQNEPTKQDFLSKGGNQHGSEYYRPHGNWIPEGVFISPNLEAEGTCYHTSSEKRGHP